MNRTVGFDVAAAVTPQLIARFTAEVGQKPAFVGRYFTSKTTKGGVEYRHRVEDSVLAEAECRVLPIARQTNHVGGALITGKCDGALNRDDILATFGVDYLGSLGGRFSIVLDVEGNGPSHLSAEYWCGWCEGLKQDGVELIPCIYGLPGDARTWNALRVALSRGATCGGILFARPMNRHEPVGWHPEDLTMYHPIDGVPILGVQYAFRGAYDADILNPEIDADDFLSTCILPPGDVS